MYTASQYLDELDGVLSPHTLRLYRNVLLSYARFLDVPLDEIHNHLLHANLKKYSVSRKYRSPQGTRTHLNILHRFFKVNGVALDMLQESVMKKRKNNGKQDSQPNDKPLTLDTLQRMMDLADSHGKAIITFLISTGCRAGETAEVLLSDVNGDLVTIRDEIAKGGHGGKVYLTSEAREYLDLWLKNRDRYLEMTDKQHQALIKAGLSKPRPGGDQRLFGCTYASLNLIFARLYKKVDGEKGKYNRSKVTTHSTRKYFRTIAVKTMPLDLVEKIMRHTGYLTAQYVRITDEEARERFHAGETVLYITRADHRIQGTAIDTLKQENEDLRGRLKQVEDNKQTDTLKNQLEHEVASLWTDINTLRDQLRAAYRGGWEEEARSFKEQKLDYKLFDARDRAIAQGKEPPTMIQSKRGPPKMLIYK